VSEPSPLSTRLLTALSWNALATGLSTLLGLVRSIILARLLAPADFGLFGLAMAVSAAATALTEFGLSHSLLAQDIEPAQRSLYMDTIWSADLLRRAAVSLLLLAAAYPSASYFGDSQLLPVLMSVSIAPFVQGLSNVGLLAQQKQLQFRTLAMSRQLAEWISTALTLLVAYLHPSVWALVFSLLAGHFINVIASYTFCSYRPRWRMDASSLRSSAGFGKHILLVGMLTFLTTQFDNLVVGRYLGAAALGHYMLAYRLANMPADLMSTVFSSAMFPAYAETRAQGFQHLQPFFERSARLGTILLVVICGSLFFAAEWLILFFYGAAWLPSVPLLLILTFQGLFRGLTRLVSPALVAALRPDLDAKAKGMEAVLFIPLTLWMVARWGALGAAWAGLISYSAAYVLRLAAVFLVWRPAGWRFPVTLTTPLWMAGGAWLAALGLVSELGIPAGAATLFFVILFLAMTLGTHSSARNDFHMLLSRLTLLLVSAAQPGKSRR
jgi:PST family polysaccharide transporter/lipopolysaccharide exporter